MNRKRKRKGLSSISMIFITAIISLSLIGVGYGYWNDGLNIYTTITVGNINPEAYIVDYSSLNINTTDDGSTIKLSGDIYRGSNENLKIRILDKGTIPVVLEEITTITDSEIVDLNRQGKMNYGLFSLSKDDIVEEFQLIISHDGNHNISDFVNYSFINDEVLEARDEIQTKISVISEEIRQLEEELSRLNQEEYHTFRYDLLFIQGI